MAKKIQCPGCGCYEIRLISTIEKISRVSVGSRWARKLELICEDCSEYYECQGCDARYYDISDITCSEVE